MPHLLLAIDDSSATRRMVEYVADVAPQLRDCRVRLVAVIPKLPRDSQKLDALISRCEESLSHGEEGQHPQLVAALALLHEFTDQLIGAGVAVTTVTSKILAECLGVAQDLYAEARQQECDTIVVGRGNAALRHLLLGSVSKQLVEKVHEMNVWIVG